MKALLPIRSVILTVMLLTFVLYRRCRQNTPRNRKLVTALQRIMKNRPLKFLAPPLRVTC